MDSLTIGKVAKQAELGVETIRYYEREGLIAVPPRRGSGYRQYPPDTVERLRFIRRAKDLGFSLKEVRELLALRVDTGTTCDQIKGRAETKIADIAERIRTLKRIQCALESLAAACVGEGPVGECPILDALQDKGQR